MVLLGPDFVGATVSDPASGVLRALLVLSHVFMLYAVVYAYNARLARIATTSFASLAVSVTYHAVRAFADATGQDTTVNVWRLCDHVCVQWVLGTLGLQLLMTGLAPRRSQFFFLVVGYLVFPIGAVSEIMFPYALLPSVIMFTFVALVGMVRVVELAAHGDKCGCSGSGASDADKNTTFARQGATGDVYFIAYMLTAVCSTLLGVVFFCLDDGAVAGNSNIDAWAHILWHCFSGIALFCVCAATSIRVETTLRTWSPADDDDDNVDLPDS